MEPKGFRRDIMVLHHLSDLMEKHPDLPRPTVKLGHEYGSDLMVHINWHMTAAYGSDELGIRDWRMGDETYEEYDARRKEAQRTDLEQRIGRIVEAVEALGEDVEWEKNDPTQEQYYYKLSTLWHGAALSIVTSRDAVCEKVVVLETEREEEVPDPAVIEAVTKAAPLVKVTVKDTITEWQCNSALAEKTAPKHTRTITRQEVA